MTKTDDDASARRLITQLDERAQHLETSSAQGAMAWRTWGAGPTLALLHGGSGSWTHWIHTIPAFEGRYRVVAGDLPGLGDSPPPTAPYSAESLGAIIADGIEQLSDSAAPVDLVGFSFGGIVGGHVAAQLGDRVRRLVIVGSPPFGLGSESSANDVRPVDPDLAFEQAIAQHRRNLGLLMLHREASIDALALRIHHDNLRRARLRSRKIARTDTLARALRQTRCALGGIWGSEDVTIHPSIESIRELLTGLRADAAIDVIDGAGHWVPFEAPTHFNGLLERQIAP